MRLKKKMDNQLKSSFPNISGKENVEIIGAQKRKMIAQLDEIIEDQDNSKKIEKESKKISDYLPMQKFGNNEGDDIKYMKRFNQLCLSIRAKTGIDAKKLTTYEF